MGKQTLSGPVHTVWWHLHKGFIFCTFMFRFRRAVDLNTIIWASMLALHIHIRVMIAVIQKWWLQCIVTTSIGILISSNEGPKAPLSFPSLPSPILYFIVYITVCRGWVGVCVMYTIENHHLHLGGGASAREDSASPREDKILPGTCISFLQRWGSSIYETPPLIITNHPPWHLH